MVDTNHRIGSSMLINQIKQNCIITVLSSLPRLEKTFLKLGFKKFNMKYKIIFIKKFFAKNIKLSFDILHNQNFLMKKTNKSQQKIIKDYNNSRFKKFIFFNSISKKKNCLIIGDVTKLIQKKHFCGEFYINKSKSLKKL